MEAERRSGARYDSSMAQVKYGEWVQAALTQAGMTQAELSRRLSAELGRSIDRAAINKILKESRDLAADEMSVIARLANYPLPEGFGRVEVRPPPEFLGERDLKVFAAVEGGPGEMVVSTDPIEVVPRPWYMKDVRDGYAVLVVGDSMEPVYEAGDMVIVNPRLPPRRNRNHILVSGESEGEFNATVKRLIGWTDRDWKLKQYNPQREFHPLS